MDTQNNDSLINCRYLCGKIILSIGNNEGQNLYLSLTPQAAISLADDLKECADKKLMAQAIQEFYAISDGGAY